MVVSFACVHRRPADTRLHCPCLNFLREVVVLVGVVDSENWAAKRGAHGNKKAVL
jgi:hypothetical protein